MSTQQSLAQLQSILERHRINESGYKDKIKEINQTRGKISDQLEILQQNYDKKVKALQQKLQIIKTHNETLIRQNVLYKSQIDTYQSRLVQKEKIIAMLLGQRKDLPVIGNSQRSKSQKTDSLNANEEQNKSFKKTAVFKEEIEHIAPPSQKFKQQIIDQRTNIQNIQVRAEIIPQHAPQIPNQIKKPPPLPKKKAVPIPVVAQTKPIQVPTPKIQQEVKEEDVIHPISNKPPPKQPPAKVKARKIPKNYPSSNFNSRQQIQQQPVFQANNFFSNLGKQNNDEDAVNNQQNPNEQQKVQKQPFPQQIQQIQEIKQEVNNYHNHQTSQQVHQQEYHQNVPIDQQNQQNINTQVQQPQTNSLEPPIVQQQNNFLSHFSNSYDQNSFEPYQLLPVQKNRKKPKQKVRARVESLDSEVSGNDFFSQLAKPQNEHHNLQIQQSSIDHIDRDNSLMSNEQPYFVEEPEVVKKIVKMPKKKGKRDQIKMIDPSCFD